MSYGNSYNDLMAYLEGGDCYTSIYGRQEKLAVRALQKSDNAGGIVYTMVQMAKFNALNIYKFLTYLLNHRLSEDMSDEQLET